MGQSAVEHATGFPAARGTSFGWIRNPSFDLTLILGVAGIALGSGIALAIYPAAFETILLIDLWFLGYHHVVATFTRLTFDVESFRQHRFLIFWVPIILVVTLVPLVLAIGPWLLATLYLYWQWFHYTRQSYGISRIYHKKANPGASSSDWVEQGIIYVPAIWGILSRSWQNPGTFLDMELRVLPIPQILVQAAGIATALCFAAWIGSQVIAIREKRFQAARAMYLLSHVAIFVVGYIVITDINHGWLVVNIWHNAQYVLIVWMYNNNRFKKGIEPKHWFLSVLSQSRNVLFYFAVCLLITTIVYGSINSALALVTTATLPLAVIVYQTINFHHYIVDAVLWKIRKTSVSSRLGISS